MEKEEQTKLEQFVLGMKKRKGQIRTFQEFDATNPDYRQEYFNTQVTRDGIKHFVDGIGDINPIFRDRNYARATKYGRIVAPPAFLETINYSQHPENVPSGIQGFLSGFEWEYFRPVLEGDEYTARVIYPFDVQMKPSRFAGQLVIITEKGILVGMDGQTGATYTSLVIFMEGSKAKERGTSKEFDAMPKYSKQEIEKIYKAQDEEKPRGAVTRYWEDVEVGEDLPPVVRGPYTLSEKFAWFVGKGNPPSCVSDRLFRLIAAKHHENKGVYDPTLNIHIRPSMFDASTMTDRGISRIHDAGAQRNAWRNMVLTNWIGDDGFLWKSKAEVRGFNLEGDVTWCKGKVTDKYIQNGMHCVNVNCWCENQRHEVTMPGEATVILSSRERGPVTYPEPDQTMIQLK
jgi:acyl dehydratase